MRYETSVGTMFYRDDYDIEVIKEVIDRLEYFRWGEIEINPGDLVIDAGAHIGSFTRLALSKGARVIAIEPHPGNFTFLTYNTEGIKGRLTTINSLLWNGGPVRFLSDPDRNELHKIDKAGDLVDSVSLDNICSKFDLKDIDLLKMDIEGAEYKVLYEFKQLFRVKQLTLEWHYGSTKLAELIIFLEKNGLIVTWLGGNGQWGKLQCKRKTLHENIVSIV